MLQNVGKGWKRTTRKIKGTYLQALVIKYWVSDHSKARVGKRKKPGKKLDGGRKIFGPGMVIKKDSLKKTPVLISTLGGTFKNDFFVIP